MTSSFYVIRVGSLYLRDEKDLLSHYEFTFTSNVVDAWQLHSIDDAMLMHEKLLKQFDVETFIEVLNIHTQPWFEAEKDEQSA